MTSVAVCGCPTSVAVRQHPQDVCVSPSAHAGRLWLSVSTHRTFVAVRVCLCVSVCVRQHTDDVCGFQYTQDVPGCPSAHTGRPCVSVSTHRTSMAVRVCPCVSVSTHRTSEAVHQYTYHHVGPLHIGRLWVSANTHRTYVAVRLCPCVSVCVRQHTQDVRGSPSVNISAHWSLDSARWPFLWTVWVVLAHVGCLFSTYRTSVGVRQHTQDIRGCPWLSAAGRQHTHDICGCPCVSVCVHVCPSAYTGRLWLSISTHISTLVLGLSTLTLPVDCSGDFGPRGLSASTHRTSVGVRQHTQDVRVCPSAHTGRPWVSVCVRLCPSAHTRRLWLPICTHISTLVVRVSTLTLPLVCSGDFGPRGLSVQYTQDVSGCPPAHTGCPWLSVCVCVCPSAHTERLWLSFTTDISTLVLGLSTLALPVDYLGDFGPHGLSVQYTHDVCGCPPAHTGRPWLSDSTHRTSVTVRQQTHDVRDCLCVSVCVCGCQPAHTGRSWLSVAVRQHTQDVHVCPSAHTGCPCVSVCVRSHTQDVRGCPSYTQDVRGCPPAHTGCPWLSVSTHRTSVAVHQYTYQHSGHSCGMFGGFWPTWAVCLVHTGRLWVSIRTHSTFVCVGQHTHDVRGCLCVSVSTHRRSVAVHQYTYQHAGPWTQHAGHSLDCFGDFGQRGLSVQYTQDVRGCPPAHTRRSCVSVSTHRTSVAVRVCPSAHTGRPWLFVCVRQHTQDVRGCPCVSVRTHKNICGCPSIHISARWFLDSARWPFPWTVWVILAHVGCLFSTHRTSVGVRRETQDVRGCPSAHTRRLWLSMCVHQHTQDVRDFQFVHISARCHFIELHPDLVQLPARLSRAIPSPSSDRHEAVRSRHVSSSSSPPTVDGFGTGTPEPSPQSQSFSRSYGSILPTSLAYIVPSTKGCSPWRPDAVMSTTGPERHSVLRTFKGHRECTRHHATCGHLPATGPYLWLSRFQGFAATAAPSYSSRRGSCHDGRVSAQLGTITRLPVHPASPVQLTKYGPLGALDFVGWLNKAAIPSNYPEGNFGGNQLLDVSISLSPLYPSQTNDLHVSMLTLEPFSEDQGRSAVHPLGIQPISFLAPYGFTHPLTRTHVRLLGLCFKTGRMGSPQADALCTQMPRHTVRHVLTCSLSVSCPYLALDRIYRSIGAAFPNNPTRRQRLVVPQDPGTMGLSPSLAPLSRELGPGPSLRTLLQTTIRTPKTSDFQAGLFPVRSPLLRESLLVSFTPLIDMLKLSG
ncbi:hypothetical protein YC2023_071950 [Brassica napus]